MNRTYVKSSYGGSHWSSSDRSVRVNVYGSNSTKTEELDAAYEAADELLNHLYAAADGLDGYDVYCYETDVTLHNKETSTHEELIDKGYNALDGSGYDDEHVICLWVYNSSYDHAYFAMGHDIDGSSAYGTFNRQPFVADSCPLLYDIHQAFVYLNTFYHDPYSKKPSVAHELAHSLVNHKYVDISDMYPSNPDQNVEHYLGGNKQDMLNEWTTVMSLSSDDAVQRGECDGSESKSDIRIDTTNCTRTAHERAIQYFKDHNNPYC